MTLSEFTYISFLFCSDLDHVRLHAVGGRFDDITLNADSLATFARYTADTVAKIAISMGEDIKSFSKSKQVIDDTVWAPEDKQSYGYNDYISFLDRKGRDYIEAIEDTRNTIAKDNDTTSDQLLVLDKVLLFWREEVLYKNAARLVPDNETPAPEIIEVSDDNMMSNVDYGMETMSKVTDVPVTMEDWVQRFKDRVYSPEEIVAEVDKIFSNKGVI